MADIRYYQVVDSALVLNKRRYEAGDVITTSDGDPVLTWYVEAGHLVAVAPPARSRVGTSAASEPAEEA